MKKYKLSLCLVLFVFGAKILPAQSGYISDVMRNNLIHLPGYQTSVYGEIPHYTKYGTGKKNLILIPGLGFGASIFQDFINANKSEYTMYAITIPGYENTNAPPMPVLDTSYGAQYWNTGLIIGLLKLIDKEKLNKPVIVGHFVQGSQMALRMAIDYPDKTGAVIIFGGPAKFITTIQGKAMEFPLSATIKYVDNTTAQKWFKPISKKEFDDGNYLPEIYSIDSIRGKLLWHQSAAVPLPVMVRYLCEFCASDVTLEMYKIKCPVLVLSAGFNTTILAAQINDYVQPQFIDSWNKAPLKNSLITVKNVPGASVFVWKDSPLLINKQVKQFISNIK